MKTTEYSSDYTWSTVEVSNSPIEDLQTCKGCKRRNETTLHCDMLDTARTDDDIACAHYKK